MLSQYVTFFRSFTKCLGSHNNSAASKTVSENDLSEEGTAEDTNMDEGMVKLTKAEKRAKLKKMKKEAKKQGKEMAKAEVEETPHAAVLVLSNQIKNHSSFFMVSQSSFSFSHLIP